MLNLRNIIVLIAICISIGCNQDHGISQIDLYDRNDKAQQISFENYDATVITFLGPECPLSENYTKTINDLDSTFKSNVHFINIFPGTFYSKEAIDSFMHTYNVMQNCLLDADFDLVRELHATITPESFVFDRNGKLVYSGAIDNWAVDLGQKRQVITEFYVRDVLNAMLQHKEIPYTKTTAVGCFIEKEAKQHH